MTVFDALLIAVIGISVFFATVRGGVRELATVAALAIAALAAFLLMTPVSAVLGKHSFFVSAGVGGVIGLGVFGGAYFMLHKLMLRWKPSAKTKSYDKIGGGVFGLIRALALIGLGFLGYGYYLDEANQPDAVRKALLLPVAAASAGFFEQFAPPNRELNAANAAKNAAADGYDGADRSGLKEIVTTVTTSDKDAKTASDDPIADILNEETPSDAKPQRR
ncbi:MAG: CvpA family protein [Pseudomonadota bacterium]